MTWKESFKHYAIKLLPQEACGLVALIDGEEKFWPCENLADDKQKFFMVNPDDWAECEDSGDILGVLHSHPNGPEIASEADKKACEYIGFPYYIYSIKTDSWISLFPSDWIYEQSINSIKK